MEKGRECNKKRSSQELKQQRVTDPLWEAWRQTGIQYMLWWEIAEANSSADRKQWHKILMGVLNAVSIHFLSVSQSLLPMLSRTLTAWASAGSTLSWCMHSSFLAQKQHTHLAPSAPCIFVSSLHITCIIHQAVVVIVHLQQAFRVLYSISQWPQRTPEI